MLGKANFFNLAHHTLRFTPHGSQYSVETIPWQWDTEFGAEMPGSEATLKSFAFPFFGQELEHVLSWHYRFNHLR